MKLNWLWIIIVLFITGCSKDENQEVVNPWEDQIRFMEETKQVDEMMIDAAGRRDQEMEEQLQ